VAMTSRPNGRRDTTGPATSRRGPGRPSRVFAIGAFAMFVALWIGFAVVVLGDPRSFDPLWQGLRSLPTPIQVIAWVVFLPLAVGLWIWESSWAPIVSLMLACGMIAWTLVAVNGMLRALRPA